MKEKQLKIITHGNCNFEALNNEEQQVFCSLLLTSILEFKKRSNT